MYTLSEFVKSRCLILDDSIASLSVTVGVVGVARLVGLVGRSPITTNPHPFRVNMRNARRRPCRSNRFVSGPVMCRLQPRRNVECMAQCITITHGLRNAASSIRAVRALGHCRRLPPARLPQVFPPPFRRHKAHGGDRHSAWKPWSGALCLG